MVLRENSWESLGQQGYQTIHPKGNQPWYSLEGQMLKMKLQYFGYLIRRASSLEKTLMLGKIEGRRGRGWQRMRWLDWHACINGHVWASSGNGVGEGNLACCSPWGHKESDRSNWLTNNHHRPEKKKKKKRNSSQTKGPGNDYHFWTREIKGKIMRFLILGGSEQGHHRPEIQITLRKITSGRYWFLWNRKSQHGWDS